MNRKSFILAVVAVLLIAGSMTWYTRIYRANYFLSHEMVRMRDGILLATDIYHPARRGKPLEGKLPVLLTRTLEDKNDSSARRYFNFYARQGYVVVVQDVRGRFASQGEFYPFLNEGTDGYDTIEWAAAQPWSNGKVGTFGYSYAAWNQLPAAIYRPPHLVAMFIYSGGGDFYREWSYRGGASNPGWPLWILGAAASSPEAAREPGVRETLSKALKDPRPWLALHPKKRAETFQGLSAYKRTYEDFYAHPEFDDYWKQKGFYTIGYNQQIKDVPVLFLSGWYDDFAEGVLDSFAGLARVQQTPKKLIMGPWKRGYTAADCGNASFGPAARVMSGDLVVDWFDHWMKGDPFQMVPAEAVKVFRMGGGDGLLGETGQLKHGGIWLTTSVWPPPEVILSKFYLHAGEKGSSLLPDSPPAGEPPSTFLFDPDHPVPTIGGRMFFHDAPYACVQNQVCSPGIPGCSDSSPLNQRGDVLSFATAPLKSPIDVTGKIRATLWVSSDAVDTDFTAKLIDVYPNGYALIVTDGQIRMRYREGFARAKMMNPGAVYQAVIDLGSTSNLSAAGHRIRLDISSSNYPQFEPNPNTGEPSGLWTRRVKARNVVYHDRRHASYLELPLRPMR